MSAVTQLFSTILIVIYFLVISGCSDSSDSNSVSVDGRLTNINTPFSIEEGSEGINTTLSITFVPTVTGLITYSTFNVTAAEKSDYTKIEGSLNVVKGVEETLNITIYGDDDIEGIELIGLKLVHNGEDLSIFYGQILNDDFPSIEMTSTTVLEGDTGISLLEFTFRLQSEIVDPYTFLITSPKIDISQNNPDLNVFYAVPGEDFIPVEQSLEFSKDVSEISIYVEVLADNILELDEIVELQILSSDILYDTVRGTIRTDDTVDGDGFDLQTSSSKVLEGDSDEENNITWKEITYTINVNDDGNLVQNQNIQIRLEGINDDSEWATLGEDFCANNYGLDFESDESAVCEYIKDYTLEVGSKSIDVSFFVKQDLDVESGNEKIKVYLQNNQGVSFSEFIHTIQEDDFPGISITYKIGDEDSETATFEALLDAGGIQITEPSDEYTLVTIELNLQKPLDANFHLSYRVVSDGSASSADYESSPANGSIDIDNGVIGLTIQLKIKPDSAYEATEKLSLIIDNIGTLPISIVNTDLPELIIKNKDGSSVTPNDLQLHEPEIVSSQLLSSDNVNTYRLVLDDKKRALDTFDLSYEIGGGDTTLLIENNECAYLNSVDKFLANQDDFVIKLQGEETNKIEFEEGRSSIELTIEIVDDLLVECLEFIPLTFTLSPRLTSNATELTYPKLDVMLSISNKDKTTLQVAGWTTNEGSSNEDELPDTQQAFVLTMGQSLVTDFTYTLEGENLESCGADDIKNTVNGANFGFDGSELAKSIAVQISQDNVVEPDEECILSIASFTNSGQIDLLYCDEAGNNCSSDSTFAPGIIKNDDKLIIDILSDNNVIEPAESNSEKVYPVSIKWDKDIATNVGGIILTLVDSGCTGSQDCVEGEDYDLTADYKIKSYLNSNSIAAPLEADNWGLTISPDAIIENNEFLNLSLSQSSGSDFIESVSLDNLSIEIQSEDTLSVGLQNNDDNSTCEGTDESGCQIIYTITFDKEISDDVNNISVDLVIADSNTSTIKVADNTEYVDAIIYIDDIETHPKDNKINIPVLDAGEVKTPVIKIIFNEDNVVEVNETLSLFIEKNTVDDRYSVSGDIIQTVNNDDFLNITFTQSDNSEKDLGESLTYPFTYIWDKEISPDVPTIQFVYESVCGIDGVSPSVNCAESNDSNIASIGTLITVHDTSEDAYTTIPDTPLNLNLNYVLDARVEADEHLTIEINKIQNPTDRQTTNESGQVFVSHLNGLEDDSLELNSIIQNDDYLSLTVGDITSTDDTCSGFNGESGCKIYSISWGGQVADSDAGDIIVPLSLPSLSSHTRYSADGSTNPKDYSVILDGSEITYAYGANSLNLGSGLGENESVPLVVSLVDDDFVEPGESLTVSLNATDSPYVDTINSSDSAVSVLAHTIPLDDLLTVTITGNTSGVEAEDANGVVAPFTYTTDNAVAANAPTLTVTLSESTCTGSCATLNTDFTLPSLNTLHNTLSPTSSVTTGVDLGLGIQADNIVENDEKVNLQMRSNNTELVKFSSANTQELTYTINNTDTLDLVVTDITNQDATCSGFSGEDGCKLYDISWVNGTDSNLGDVILAMNTEGSTSEMFYTQQAKSGEISIIENPKDYSLTISDAALTGTTEIPLGTGLTGEGSKQFKVTIEDDNYVELEDTLALNLSASAGSAIINSLKIGSNAAVLNSANAGYASLLTHTVPATSDKLNVTVSTGTSGPEAGDTDGVANPFTYTTSNNIVASVPNILLNVGQVTCGGTETCATITDDFTLPNAIALHDTGTYTAQNQSNSNLGVVVQPDNIIESDELIKLSLAAKSTDGSESPYVSYTPSNPTHTITNADVLNLTITDNTTDTSCTDFSEETASCRSYKIAWQNILQSGAAVSIAITEADNNVAERSASEVNGEESDPQDYSITVGGNEVADLITLANEEADDGNDTTNSMTVTVNITEDDFVEPSEKLNVYFSKPSGDNTINNIDGFNAENTITHTIPVDDKLVISFSGSGTSGGEPKYETGSLVSGTVSNPLKYITNLAIAANTELIQLNVNERGCGSGLDCATIANGDFTITNPLTIHTKGSYKLAGESSLGVYIEDDEVVEVDESIKVRVSEDSSYIDSIISRDSTYTINNNDKTVLSFVEKSNFNGDEGDSGSGNVEYSIQSSLAVSPDIGNLYVNVSLDGSSTASSTDATVPSTLEFKGSSAISAGASKNFNVAIIGEEIVELDETVIPKITLHTGSSDYTEIDSTKSKGATYTINNDDYIDLEIIGGTCSESSGIATCAMTEGDTGSSAFMFKPKAEYETQGITDPVVTLTAINTSTASGPDYSLVASIALDTSVSDVGVTGLEKTFLTIVGDKIIERNESVLLAATIPSYVALNFPTEFTINNDDYVSVSSKNYLGPTQVDSLQEGGTLKLEFCVPSGYTYQNQNGSSDITLTATPTVSGTDSDFYKEAVCDDLKLLDDDSGIVNCDLTSMSIERSISLDGKNTGECATLDLITANTDSLADQNVWFYLGYASSDERCEGNCLPNQSTLISNSDLINTLDTGLKECVESGISERWDTPCIGTDISPTVDYLKQDAAETDFYPGLAYTFIDTNSAAVVERPTSGEVCVQDNSTGLIWSSAIDSNATANDYTINYSGDDSAQTSWDCGILNADSKAWQLPTVQELISIMDLHPVSKSKSLNENRIFDFKKIGSNYYNANSRYWSSDLCTISAANDGAWTVDFITGHVVCENISSETNAKMNVYK